jgi:WD40 repeat protein
MFMKSPSFFFKKISLNSTPLIKIEQLIYGCVNAHTLSFNETLTNIKFLDESRFATMGVEDNGDSFALIFDFKNLRKPVVLKGHWGEVFAIEKWGSDHVLTASADRTLGLWDAKTGQNIRYFRGFQETFWHKPTIIDDTYVLAFDFKQNIKVWHLNTGELVYEKKDAQFDGKLPCILPNGKFVLVDNTGLMKLCDFRTGQEETIQAHTRYISLVQVLKDGKFLTCAHNVYKIWDAETGKCLAEREFPKNSSFNLQNIFEFKDGRLGIALSQHVLEIVDGSTLKTSAVMQGLDRRDSDLLVDLGDDLLLALKGRSLTKSWQVWDVGENELVSETQLDKDLYEPMLLANGWLWAKGGQYSSKPYFRVLDPLSMQHLDFVGHEAQLTKVLGTTQALLSIAQDKTAKIWPLTSLCASQGIWRMKQNAPQISDSKATKPTLIHVPLGDGSTFDFEWPPTSNWPPLVDAKRFSWVHNENRVAADSIKHRLDDFFRPRIRAQDIFDISYWMLDKETKNLLRSARVVFRVTLTSPDDFVRMGGLWPTGKDTNLLNHMNMFWANQKAISQNSGFLSSTRSEDKAREHALDLTSRFKGEEIYVFAFDPLLLARNQKSETSVNCLLEMPPIWPTIAIQALLEGYHYYPVLTEKPGVYEAQKFMVEPCSYQGGKSAETVALKAASMEEVLWPGLPSDILGAVFQAQVSGRGWLTFHNITPIVLKMLKR